MFTKKSTWQLIALLASLICVGLPGVADDHGVQEDKKQAVSNSKEILLAAATTSDQPNNAQQDSGKTARAVSSSLVPNESAPQQPAVDSNRSTEGWADRHGVGLGASTILDWSTNLRGGAATRESALRYLFVYSVSIDSKKAFGWDGGTFFSSVQRQQGQDGTLLVADLQGYSNIDDVGRNNLSELWFEQKLFNEKLRVKVGKVDANSEFAFVENGGEFINSSMGITPTILSVPSYPEPRMSLNVFVQPTNYFYTGFGYYDTADAGQLPIVEIGGMWVFGSSDLTGRLGIGYWRHSGTWDCFDGSADVGTEGHYLVADQMLWRENSGASEDEQGVGLFLQYGSADRRISEIEQYLGGGMRWAGAFPSRDDDVLGVGIAAVRLTAEPAAGFAFRREVALEFFYQIQVTPWMSLRPDVQYIQHPGGLDLQRNAFVGSLRTVIEF